MPLGIDRSHILTEKTKKLEKDLRVNMSAFVCDFLLTEQDGKTVHAKLKLP